VSRSLVLASCAQLPAGDGDEAGLVGRMGARGVAARWAPWGEVHGPGDTVVIRATWDYTTDPERFLAIIDIRARLDAGRYQLDGGGVVIGSQLATELGVTVGDKLRLTSTEGVDDVVTVQGLFTLGNQAVDASWVITTLRHAQALYALPGGATTIELKVDDVFAADRIAADVRALTGLRAESWMSLNADLLEGLEAAGAWYVPRPVLLTRRGAWGRPLPR
jgi:hypothetical protein